MTTQQIKGGIEQITADPIKRPTIITQIAAIFIAIAIGFGIAAICGIISQPDIASSDQQIGITTRLQEDNRTGGAYLSDQTDRDTTPVVLNRLAAKGVTATGYLRHEAGVV